MRKFDVWTLVMLLHHINEGREALRGLAEDKESSDVIMEAKFVETFLSGSLMSAEMLSQKLGLDATYKRVWNGGGPFWMMAQVGITYRQAYDELRVLKECIEADLENKWFAFIIPSKAQLLENAKHDWKAIIDAIPDSQDDIREALYCYALERNTAAVFHLMRVAEWGLRAFCHHLGFRKVRSFIKKKGKNEFTPIEYSTWETILSQLRTRVSEKLAKLKRGSIKQERQEFYNPVLSDIEGFKDAWRNHVMHTRRDFNEHDAMAVISHVQRFMSLLVANGVAHYEPPEDKHGIPKL